MSVRISAAHRANLPEYTIEEIEADPSIAVRMVRGVSKITDGNGPEYYYRGRSIDPSGDCYHPWRVGGLRNGQSHSTLAKATADIDARIEQHKAEK